jgi:hypothetical protein
MLILELALHVNLDGKELNVHAQFMLKLAMEE